MSQGSFTTLQVAHTKHSTPLALTGNLLVEQLIEEIDVSLSSLAQNYYASLVDTILQANGYNQVTGQALGQAMLNAPEIRSQAEALGYQGALSQIGFLRDALDRIVETHDSPSVDVPDEPAPSEPWLPEPSDEVVWESGDNSQLSTANTIPMGASVKGYANENGDIDHFKFVTQLGGNITLNFTHPYGPGNEGALMRLALLNHEGKVISERDFRGDGALHATLDQPGTFFLRITDATGYNTGGVNGAFEEGAYKVTTHFTSHTNAAFDAAESNSLSGAVAWQADGKTPILFSTSLHGSFKKNGDSDVFRLSAEKGGVVSLDFKHPNGPGSEGARIDISLLDANGQLITLREVRGDEVINAALSEGGEYYVRISDATGYGTGGVNGHVEDLRYKMLTSLEALDNTAFDGSSSGTLTGAISTLGDGVTPLRFGNDLIGVAGTSGDSDSFRLHADSGGKIIIDFQHPAGPGTEGARIDVTLMDAQGNSIADWQARGNSTFNATVDQEGDYILRIEDATGYNTGGINGNVEDGLYSLSTLLEKQDFTAYDTANNHTLGNAVSTLADGITAINFEHTIVGTAGSSGDTDTFLVTANSSTDIIVAFTHPNGVGSEGAAMSVTVYDSQGSEIIAQQFRGNGDMESFTAQGGEDYFIRISDDIGYGTRGKNGLDVETGFYQVEFLIA